ncbi:MAG: cache domain-containing protein [Deltaproteobacteria bacterium]|nr:cache domain-containing protein [Deltaproteobacteria bacterium]MBN2672482.1 cache domain-containing protein [Deltaproteobacteria bacterium]
MKRNIILHVITPVAISILLFAGTFALVVLPFVQNHLMDYKRDTIREIANVAWGVLNRYNEEVTSGRMTLAHAQEQAIIDIRNMRYGPNNKDYLWINDTQPRMIMHPYRTDLEGKDVTNYPDPSGHLLFLDFVETARDGNEGYVNYVWQWQDDPSRVLPKVSFVKGFKPWGWILGTGIYVKDVEHTIKSITQQLVGIFMVIMAVITALSVYVISQGIAIENRRLEAEQAQINSERRLSDIISFLPDATFVVDKNKRVIAWNRAMEQITGLKEKEMIGRESMAYTKVFFPRRRRLLIDLIFAPDKIVEYAKDYVRFHQEGQTVSGEIFAPQLGKEGRFLFSVACPLYDEKENIIGAIESIRDITERVKIQERLIQSEKMLSIGGLAAGMAHEINNPLAGVIHNAELVQMRIAKESQKNLKTAAELDLSFPTLLEYVTARKIPGLLDNVLSSAKRAAQIVDNMLGFARKSKAVMEKVSLPVLLDDALELAKTNFNIKKRFDFKKIEVVKQYESDIPEVHCESGKIQQVFLNILQNAAYAMTQMGGDAQRLTLRISRETGEFVRIEIEDNGPGIPEEMRQRIFEPFFTTKEVGDGTGLGLSISYFIVSENHGGTLEVIAGKDGGSNFVIRLPLTNE